MWFEPQCEFCRRLACLEVRTVLFEKDLVEIILLRCFLSYEHVQVCAVFVLVIALLFFARCMGIF